LDVIFSKRRFIHVKHLILNILDDVTSDIKEYIEANNIILANLHISLRNSNNKRPLDRKDIYTALTRLNPDVKSNIISEMVDKLLADAEPKNILDTIYVLETQQGIISVIVNYILNLFDRGQNNKSQKYIKPYFQGPK